MSPIIPFPLAIVLLAAAPAEEPAIISAGVHVHPESPIGKVSPLVYGHFLEHFHRVIYGGVYDPGSPKADAKGFRTDVIEALRRIRAPIFRWPGGCFASAYHWMDGIGPDRPEVWDKAWRVVEPNSFGTDEFVAFCRLVGAEPYICGNAGTGTPEEMSDWVEYANGTAGKWARRRIANGNEKPFGVRYWSIGNENWGGHEIGAKSPEEFARFVTETAKMVLRADGSCSLLAPSISSEPWDRPLIRSAGPYLDFIAVHIYSDPLWGSDNPSPYPVCARRSLDPEGLIARTEGVLRAVGEDRLKIAVDEWNLRGWHHPDITTRERNPAARDRNDLNSTYTCADAVYAGCFLNACIRHADRVGMANFAPTVNARGAIYAYPEGIVLRPTYHVFDLFANRILPEALEAAVESDPYDAAGERIPAVDAAVTGDGQGGIAIAAVNRHAEAAVRLAIRIEGSAPAEAAEVWTVTGPRPDSFNDRDHPEDVALRGGAVAWDPKSPSVVLPPHSVNAIRFRMAPAAVKAAPGLLNGSFELLRAPTLALGWRPTRWGGEYVAGVSGEAPRSGKSCVSLQSSAGADCGWIQRVPVVPRSRYRLSGWIRTRGVEAGSGRGAFLNVQEVQGPTSEVLTGTVEWTRVSLDFDTGSGDRVQVNCLLGGWGQSRGMCWFDDITLEKIGN